LILGPTQPHIQWTPQALFPSLKQLGHAADYSPPSSAKVEDVWRYTSQWSGAYEIQHRDFTCVWPVLVWTDRRLSGNVSTKNFMQCKWKKLNTIITFFIWIYLFIQICTGIFQTNILLYRSSLLHFSLSFDWLQSYVQHYVL
jgi:hypothetical protein